MLSLLQTSDKYFTFEGTSYFSKKAVLICEQVQISAHEMCYTTVSWLIHSMQLQWLHDY